MSFSGQQYYYIGDSKYYKTGNELGRDSICKQYTYARNVIQWNVDLFNGVRNKKRTSGIKLRDDETEGYNIIPNFFISARMDKHFRYDEDGIKENDKENKSYQFRNRLFDRDTLLLFHYDVNFLFVLSLYARNDAAARAEWKEKLRGKFRESIQKWLRESYDFYILNAHPGVEWKDYIHCHFKDVVGKIYRPFKDEGTLLLALENVKDDSKVKEDADINIYIENAKLIAELEKSFNVMPFNFR